jgi:5-hydroxyisourate hydrolase
MSKISAHVLDTALGRPAAEVAVRLDVLEPSGAFRELGRAETNADGRIPDLLAGRPLEARLYRVVFEVAAYFAATQRASFYPRVEILFAVAAPSEHHHIPLLLSPYGYTTYRGS